MHDAGISIFHFVLAIHNLLGDKIQPVKHVIGLKSCNYLWDQEILRTAAIQ